MPSWSLQPFLLLMLVWLCISSDYVCFYLLCTFFVVCDEGNIHGFLMQQGNGEDEANGLCWFSVSFKWSSCFYFIYLFIYLD